MGGNMKALSFERPQLESFITVLAEERNGRMHHRRKISDGQATFVTVNVEKEDGPAVSGRISGPLSSNAAYWVGFSDLSEAVEILINLEDPSGIYSVEKAYADIQHALGQMMKSPHKTVFNGRDTSLLKGFYVKSTGKNKVGETGKATLSRAVRVGQISKSFRRHCIRVGFTMEYFS
jgi:hypothetical protein